MHKKTLWHQKSQKEQRAPRNSSSFKLEQMVLVGCLLVWLYILVDTLFFVFYRLFKKNDSGKDRLPSLCGSFLSIRGVTHRGEGGSSF